MSILSLIWAILPLSLGLPPDVTSGRSEALPSPQAGSFSHLDAHLNARPPQELLRALGDEDPEAICKGYDLDRERVLTAALLSSGLRSRVIRVGVASNGAATAGLVKLQAGDKQSDLIWIADVEADAAQVVGVAFATLPELDHLDVWAAVPGEREFESVHRPVFTLSVPRDRVADLLERQVPPAAVLARCGCIRLDSLLLKYAIDGPAAVEVHPPVGEVLAQESLADQWVRFGAGARASGELDEIPADGPVTAVLEGDAERRTVALTIDDGPHPLTTPLTLEVLRREGVKATFFVVGEKVEQYPELTRMILRDGHEIGNHTYSHIPLAGLNPRGVWSQLRGCDVALEQACGIRPRFTRPPGGDFTEATLRLIDKLGYVTVLWTANTGDWAPLGRDEIVANALAGLRPGGIILMHQGDLWSLDALPAVIAGVRQAGLEVGTVSDAVGEGPIEERNPADLVAVGHYAKIDHW